jgi:predicted RNA-binding Zn ribbon-like protein
MDTVPTKQQAAFQFDLTGGHPALDLANTVTRRDDPTRRREHLENFADLISFALQDKILSPKEARDLQVQAGRGASEATRSFRRAITLRETLYRVFAATAKGLPAPADDLLKINKSAVEALQHRCLARGNGSYHWEWQTDCKNPLDRILWPIAQSAVELLTSGELKLVRWCEAPDCDWLFLDHSRNRSRRWCDMNSCGNRAKARRHYERTRE